MAPPTIPPNGGNGDGEGDDDARTWRMERHLIPEARSLAALNLRLSRLEGRTHMPGDPPTQNRRGEDERSINVERMVSDLHKSFYGKGQAPGLKTRVDHLERMLENVLDTQAKQFRYLWLAFAIGVGVVLYMLRALD